MTEEIKPAGDELVAEIESRELESSCVGPYAPGVVVVWPSERDALIARIKAADARIAELEMSLRSWRGAHATVLRQAREKSGRDDARIAELEAELEPQPMETAPRDGRPVLIWETGSSDPYVARWSERKRLWLAPGGISFCEEPGTNYTATHWAPVRKRPATMKEGG